MNRPFPVSRVAFIVFVVLALISLALGVRHFMRPVRVEARWTIEFRSPVGPTDVYLGNTQVGTTPLDLTIDASDPRITRIDISNQSPTHSGAWVLQQLGEQVEPLGPPSALPPSAVHGGLAGGVPMRGHRDDPAINFWWFKEVVRRSDGSLEVVQPILIEDDVEQTAYAFLLRFRRGAELAPDLDATQKRSGTSKVQRTVLRRATYDLSTILVLGESHDLEKLAAEHGGGEWWLSRFEPGAPTLDEKPARD